MDEETKNENKDKNKDKEKSKDTKIKNIKKDINIAKENEKPYDESKNISYSKTNKDIKAKENKIYKDKPKKNVSIEKNKTYKKIEQESKKNIYTKKGEGEKVKIKKFTNKPHEEFLDSSKRAKTKGTFNDNSIKGSNHHNEQQYKHLKDENNRLNKTQKNINAYKVSRNKNEAQKTMNKKNNSYSKRIVSNSQKNIDYYTINNEKSINNISSKKTLKKDTKQNKNKVNIKESNHNYNTNKKIISIKAYINMGKSRNDKNNKNKEKNLLNQSAVYRNKNKLNKDIKESETKNIKKKLMNVSFTGDESTNDALKEKLKSGKIKQKNKNKVPASLRDNKGHLIQIKKYDNSKMNKTFIK